MTDQQGLIRCCICKNPEGKAQQDFSTDTSKITCPRCGTFSFNHREGWTHIDSDDHVVRLGGWIRQQNDAGVRFVEITAERRAQTKKMKLPGMNERADKALFICARLPNRLGRSGASDIAASVEFQGRSFSPDAATAAELIEILFHRGHLERGPHNSARLTVAGLLYLESLNAAGTDSRQGFVAMSFDKTMDDIWVSGFGPAIEKAGFVAIRIDQRDYVGGISDAIIAEIRRSRFVVADYTDHKHGVYFEAGFALGLGLTVIPTCRADQIDALHFDIRHLNTLSWKSPEDLKINLARRISAVVGS